MTHDLTRETRVREALTCSRNSFACVHGDHEIDAADLRALLSEVAALRKECDDLSEANWIMQKRLAMAEAEIVRLGAGG